MIELLLIKKSILIHYIFNNRIDKRKLFIFQLFTAWIRIMLMVHNFMMVFKISYVLLVLVALFLEFIFYFFCVYFILNVKKINFCWCLIFAEYFRVFSFLVIVWDYDNMTLYECVIEILIGFVHVKIISLCQINPTKRLAFKVLFFRFLSKLIFYSFCIKICLKCILYLNRIILHKNIVY